MGELLSKSEYSKLLSDVRKLIEGGKAQAEEAARNEIVQMYWEIGSRISEEKLTDNASYGDSIIADLAEDLDVDESTLYRCVSFFKLYKDAPRGGNLTWSHYKELMGVKDDSVRLMLEEKAGKEEWSRERLVQAIKAQREQRATNKSGAKKLNRPSDASFVYKAVVEKVVDGDTLLLRIDLGFLIWKEQRIRLAEVDCPALDEDGGKEAANFVQEQMTKVEFVMVKTNKIDVYGRYIGHIFYSLSEDADRNTVFEKGKYLNQELLDKGLAVTL